jgi:hypothetical protein
MPSEANENFGVIGNTKSEQKNVQGHTSQQQTQMWENVESKYAGLQCDYQNWVPNEKETGDSDRLFFLAYKAITFRPITRILGTVPNRDQAAEIARYYLNLVDMSKISTYFSRKILFSPDNWLSLVKQGRGLDSNDQPLLFVSDHAEQLYKAACEILNNENTNRDQWRYALDVLELLTKCDNKYRELAHLILARSILLDKADDFLVRKENIHPSTGFDRQTKQKPAFEINEKRSDYSCEHIKELPLWGCDNESILSGFVEEMTLADVVMITDHLHQEDQEGSRQYDLNKFLKMYFKVSNISVLQARDAASLIANIVMKIGCKNFYEVLNQIGAAREVSFIDLLGKEKSDTDSNSFNWDHEKFLYQKSFNEKKSLLGLNLLYNVEHLQDLGDEEIRNVLSWLRGPHTDSFCKFVKENIKSKNLSSRISSLILSTDSLMDKLNVEQKDQLVKQLLLSKEDVRSLKLLDPYSNTKLRLRILNETKDESRFEEILGTLSSALNDLKKLNEKGESYSKKAEYYSLKLALEQLPEDIKDAKRKSVVSLLILERSEMHEHLLDRSSLSKLVDNLQENELKQFKRPEQNLARIILKNDVLREKFELAHQSENPVRALVGLFNVAWTRHNSGLPPIKRIETLDTFEVREIPGGGDLSKEIMKFIIMQTLSKNCANAFVEWILQQQNKFKTQILEQLLCNDYYVYFNRVIKQLNNEVLLNLIINIARVENTNEILKEIIRNTSDQKTLLSNIFNKEHINQFDKKHLIELFSLYKNLFEPNLRELLNMFSSSSTYVDLRSMIENYIWEKFTFDNLSQGLLDENLRDSIADFICSDTNVGNINKRINLIGKLLLQPKLKRNEIFKELKEERFSSSYKEYKGGISLLFLMLKRAIVNSGLGKLIGKMFGKKSKSALNFLTKNIEFAPVDIIGKEIAPIQRGELYHQSTGQEMPIQRVDEVNAVIAALEKINGYLITPKTRLWPLRESKTLPIKKQIYNNLRTYLLEARFEIKDLKLKVNNELEDMDNNTRKISKVFRGLVIDTLDKVDKVPSQDQHILQSKMKALFDFQNQVMQKIDNTITYGQQAQAPIQVN